MIDIDFVSMLRCPFDGTALKLVDSATVSRLNEAILAGNVRDRADQLVSNPVDGGLVTTVGDFLYPIRNQIPCLVVDEAIALN